MRPKNLEKEQAIRTAALHIISEEGLENLSMQKLAKAANVSPRTIYIKYKDKEDFLIRLFVEEVLRAYEKAVLENFSEDMKFSEGVRKIWSNTIRFLKNNKPYFALMQYGTSSPLLNTAFQKADIKEGDFFKPIHLFLKAKVKSGAINNFPEQVNRALIFAPLMSLMNEYFDYKERPKQIITEKVLAECCEAVIKGMKKQTDK